MPELIIKRRFHVDRKGHQITPHIKINNEHMRILTATQNEDWTKSGVKTAGWMSKHVLWNRPTLQASVADINKMFKDLNVKINKQ